MDGPARRVLVVGAGVAGLACARTLTRAGCAVEVVERRSPGEQPGAGMYLPGSALRALRLLGLDREVARRGQTVRRQRFLDRSGRLLLDVDVEAAWRGVGACVGLRRSALHDVLRAGADEVPVRWGVTVRTVTAADGVVRVELDDGSTSEHDLVVGADGVHSTVRRLAFGPDTGGARPLGQLGWRFLAPRPPAVRDWSVLLGPGSAVLALPVDDDHVYCYADLRSGADGPSTFAADVLADFAAPVPEILAGATPGLVAPVEEVHLPRWTAPRRGPRRGRRARHLPEHGPGRRHGDGGRPRAGRLAPGARPAAGVPAGVRAAAAPADGLGAPADAPPRPHPAAAGLAPRRAAAASRAGHVPGPAPAAGRGALSRYRHPL